jgi:methionyl-tRNA synthetase
MSGKYFDFLIDSQNLRKHYPQELEELRKIIEPLDEHIRHMRWHKFLEELWKALTLANRSIDKYAPWAMMKEGKEEEAMALIALIANILAKVALLLHPVMPKTTQKIAKALGFEIDRENFKKYVEEFELLDRFTIEKIPPLFPKIEEPLMQEKKPEVKKEEPANLITIDDFKKVQIKIGTVIEAEEVPKSKKLLKLQVDVGEEKPRQIVAGIKEFYAPSELVGEQVCVVANLKPAKLMGIVSEGMLLAAKDDEGLTLIGPKKAKKAGSLVS